MRIEWKMVFFYQGRALDSFLTAHKRAKALISANRATVVCVQSAPPPDYVGGFLCFSVLFGLETGRDKTNFFVSYIGAFCVSKNSIFSLNGIKLEREGDTQDEEKDTVDYRGKSYPV